MANLLKTTCFDDCGYSASVAFADKTCHIVTTKNIIITPAVQLPVTVITLYYYKFIFCINDYLPNALTIQFTKHLLHILKINITITAKIAF